jgi:hypothetical protein
MRTSTTIRSSLLLLAASLAASACEPRTLSEATPPAASPTTPTLPPTTAPSAAPTASAATPAEAPTAAPTAEMPATGPAVTSFDLEVDRAPLLKLGCKVQENALVCGTPSTPKGEGITCGEYSQTEDLLGGLTPRVAITGCDIRGRDGETMGIYRTGCRIPSWHRYVVAADKKLELIATKEAFVKRFAPVETPAEALAFAVALTDGKALFKIELPKDAEVFLKTIDPTSVTPVADGYKVRLYRYQLCGCGPHNHLAVDYLVTRAGEVRELSSTPAWLDPRTKKLCMD